MAIKVFIKRKFPKDQNSEKELFRCIKQIRRLIPQQPGYISGEYLKSIGEIGEIILKSIKNKQRRKNHGKTNYQLRDNA